MTSYYIPYMFVSSKLHCEILETMLMIVDIGQRDAFPFKHTGIVIDTLWTWRNLMFPSEGKV